jgi:hypothetical protein
MLRPARASRSRPLRQHHRHRHQDERTGEAKNPLALSSWKTTFAVADAARQVTLPFSRLFQDGKSSSDDMAAIEVAPIGWVESPAQTMQRFADMQNSAREERFIATGNLLAAYDWLNLRRAGSSTTPTRRGISGKAS